MSRLLPVVLDPSRRRPAAVVVVVSFRARSSLFALDADDGRDRTMREAAESSPAWSHSAPLAPRATTPN